MDEPAPEPRIFSFTDKLIDAGPIGIFGWFSLLVVIIMGCKLLIMAPRSGRGASWVDIFAACLHVQTLIFIFCVPFSLACAVYMSFSNRVYVEDMMVSAASILMNITIGGVLLLSVSIRHRTTPTIEWLPAVSVLMSVISVLVAWQCRIAAHMWDS